MVPPGFWAFWAQWSTRRLYNNAEVIKLHLIKIILFSGRLGVADALERERERERERLCPGTSWLKKLSSRRLSNSDNPDIGQLSCHWARAMVRLSYFTFIMFGLLMVDGARLRLKKRNGPSASQESDGGPIHTMVTKTLLPRNSSVDLCSTRVPGTFKIPPLKDPLAWCQYKA